MSSPATARTRSVSARMPARWTTTPHARNAPTRARLFKLVYSGFGGELTVRSEMLEELAPGLWRWTVPRGGIPPTMTAYALREGDDTIMVDPLARSENEALLATLDEIVHGRVRIFVTTPFHVRGSEVLWGRWRDRYEVTIFGHEQCVHPTRLHDRTAFRPLRGGETLEDGVRAHTIGKPRRAEMPFELPSHRALAFGDAVLEIDGELRVWENIDGERRRRWYEQRFLPTLEALTRLDVERVLVTHGEPVLYDGARALAAALARRPWDR
jgi:glyoxylase-like metal-dependent hydrolase (beta-lactamase superfamily II)